MRATQPLLCRAVSSIRPLTRTTWMAKRRNISIVPPPWRPASVLDKYESPPSYHFHADHIFLFTDGWNEKQGPSVYASLHSLDDFSQILDYSAQLIMSDSSFLLGTSARVKKRYTPLTFHKDRTPSSRHANITLRRSGQSSYQPCLRIVLLCLRDATEGS